MDCGPTCLRMIAKHYGKHYSLDTIRNKIGFGRQGVSLLGISETAEKIGFRTRGVQINYEKLTTAPLPAILHWNHNHFVVLVSANNRKAIVADPGAGIISYPKNEFNQYWQSNGIEGIGLVGTALLMEPTPGFYQTAGEKDQRLDWDLVLQYLRNKRWSISQVFMALILGMLFQLILPFLTQSMVDTGINTRNIQYITVVLFAQLMLTFSNTIIGFIRSRLQLTISNSVNISILSDFWIKLTRLPVSYFSVHHVGDTIQRIGDNRQIQSFLTGQAITSLFSILNFAMYSVILILYSTQLFIVFTIGNLLYFGWIRIFLRIRRKINYETFHLSSKENNATLQLVQGMREIRLNNAERLKRWEWEDLQAKVFKLNYRTLNYGQWQTAGAMLISQGKDILTTFMVAKMVVDGQLTFGTMLAVQYIIGQLGGPIQDFIIFAQSLQDAKISMERLNEVHLMPDEEPADKLLVNRLPENKSIHFNGVSFAYPGAGNDPVLGNIDLTIEEGQTTAIVGASGSGKTTLLKLLLKLYDQYQGDIRIGEANFSFLSPSFWRAQCGSVLQDSYIFNDTIARNIAVGEEIIEEDKLFHSCRVANIQSFIETLPNGFNTQLGAGGVGISAGQQQRLLIARSVYKSPTYLFFDEATNSLDSTNEKMVVDNLKHWFKGRTVVVVAHRLSTVKEADKIIVMNEGKIVEEGKHESLIAMKSYYYHLVRNQLDLPG